MKKLHVLLIEDDLADQQIFRRNLKNCAIESELQICSNLNTAEIELSNENFDLVFCDFNLPDGTALEFLDKFHLKIKVPIVVVTSQGDIAKATESLKNGAFDFIEKGNINSGNIERVILSALRLKKESELRQRLELQIEENYANTNAIIENTDSLIWSINQEGKLTIINQNAKAYWLNHFSISFEILDDFFLKIPQQFKDKWSSLFINPDYEKNNSFVNDFIINKQIVYLEITSNQIINETVIQGQTFFVNDVSARVKSELKIKESERNFKSIFHETNIPIIVQTVKDEHIVDLNKAVSELLGFTSDDLKNKSIFEFVPSMHQQNAFENFNKYKAHELSHFDGHIKTSNNISLAVQFSFTEIIYNDLLCNLIFIVDISARKSKEEKLELAKVVAEKSAEFKSQFLSNMSHEIRTPMNAMLGFTDLLVETKLSTEQTNYVNIIKQSGADLMSIINDILDISKIEAGKMEVINTSFSLSERLNHIVQLNRSYATKKGIELLLEIENELPEFALSDEGKFTQVINNLISNAIKFTTQGSVRLNITNQFVSEKERLLRIKIIDTGIGIPESNLNSIFEDFTQVDSSLQRTHHGTGLGLSIVKKLCDLIGAEINVSSKINEGSSFSIIWPIEVPMEINIPKKENLISDKTFAGIRVLLCEDNSLNVALASRVLDQLEIKYVIANNGQEGIEALNHFTPDLILMDIQMPIMDGYEATKIIREKSSIPIIAMTSHVMQEEKDKATNAGMNGFIPKPFKKIELLKEFTRVLGRDTTIASRPAIQWNASDFKTLYETTEGDKDFAQSLILVYLKNTPLELAEFRKSMAAGEEESLKNIAHKLRSSFLVLDLEEIKELSLKIENEKSTQFDKQRFCDLLEKSLDLMSEKLKSLID